MPECLKPIIEWLKPLWDWDTAKVLGATGLNFASSAVALDYLLKTIISILTILYLLKKLREPKGKDKE